VDYRPRDGREEVSFEDGEKVVIHGQSRMELKRQ
jgi:hypothetical protein